jgi:hypothetical protein
MDVDRQTRNQIIALSRKTGTWLSALHSSVAFDSNITGHSRRAKERSDFTTRVGIQIYNRVFADNGFNRLMNPELVHEYAPKSHEEIIKMILNEGLKIPLRVDRSSIYLQVYEFRHAAQPAKRTAALFSFPNIQQPALCGLRPPALFRFLIQHRLPRPHWGRRPAPCRDDRRRPCRPALPRRF